MEIDKKITYDLPDKARDYYRILMQSSSKRDHSENYWNNLFPDRPFWSRVYQARIKNQKVKKFADFHFKLLHRVLPCQEYLHRWKISESNFCRFGCLGVENYNHLFITCPRLRETHTKLEKNFQRIRFASQIDI